LAERVRGYLNSDLRPTMVVLEPGRKAEHLATLVPVWCGTGGSGGGHNAGAIRIGHRRTQGENYFRNKMVALSRNTELLYGRNKSRAGRPTGTRGRNSPNRSSNYHHVSLPVSTTHRFSDKQFFAARR
jgi:hypothetical protein